jgi:hypothetical protein
MDGWMDGWMDGNADRCIDGQGIGGGKEELIEE